MALGQRFAFFVSILISAVAAPAWSQQPFQTLLVGVDRRQVTSLDGEWHYLVDQSPGQALYKSNGEINES